MDYFKTTPLFLDLTYSLFDIVVQNENKEKSLFDFTRLLIDYSIGNL